MVMEVPLVISKGDQKSHMNKVTYDILEHQWREKMKLQGAGRAPASQDSLEEEPVMVFQEGEVVHHDASGEEPRLAQISEVDFELYTLADVKTDE
jgi:hypothetical protein